MSEKLTPEVQLPVIARDSDKRLLLAASLRAGDYSFDAARSSLNIGRRSVSVINQLMGNCSPESQKFLTRVKGLKQVVLSFRTEQSSTTISFSEPEDLSSGALYSRDVAGIAPIPPLQIFRLAKIRRQALEISGSSEYQVLSVIPETDLSDNERERKHALALEVSRGKHAEDRMVTSCLVMVLSLAGKYRIPGHDYLDVVQLGNIGVKKAVEKFDENRGIQFSSFAYWWARREIFLALRKHTQSETPLSLDTTSTDQAERSIELPDPNFDIEQLVEKAELRQILERELHKLTPVQSSLLKLRVGWVDGVPSTQGEAADELNIAKKRARKLEPIALEQLRNSPTLIETLDGYIEEFTGCANRE